MLTNLGDEIVSKMIFQGDNSVIAGGANFYIGLCNQTPAKTDVLSDITTEPTSVGGYARIALSRTAVDWPVANLINGEFRIQSLVKSFAAVGADFDKSFTRLFLCDVASGLVGNLIGYSGAYPSALILLDGDTFPFQFEFYP